MTARAKAVLILGMGALFAATLLALPLLFPAAPVTVPALPDALAVMAEAAPETPSGGATVFLLRDLDGRVAVYRLPEEGVPDMVTDIRTGTLRRADYLSLQTGIRVEGWLALQQLLEDFGP
ncbi:MAG: hypothetical protein LBT60_07135 [Oscillospiraceae bacterium]|jgi:hypothetical protein|nr:hypothetical protein [Oscillospiraceae bacterium]